MNEFLLNIPINSSFNDAGSFFLEKPSNIQIIQPDDDNILYLWGDPVLPGDIETLTAKELIPEKLFDNISGHYYYLTFNSKSNSVILGNSIFSILPVYYYDSGRAVIISNNPGKIAAFTGKNKFNKRFILENILFYYQLFNQTCYRDISLLPSNSHIQISTNKLTIIKHTWIENFFVATPRPWKKSLDDMSDLFIQVSTKYFPKEHYVSALTGGFDGRTLVSCGLFHNKNFDAYGFGTAESEDIKIASLLSENSKIRFNHIDLNEAYIHNHSLENGLEFIKNADGNASFARAHYLYAAKELAQKTKYIITGNFGSEIFRAAHEAGVVISPNLYKLFMSKSFDEAIKQINESKEFRWLNRVTFKNEWEELVEDLKTISRFHSAYNDLPLNQQFYVVVFEEVFRKYFGTEMVNQYKYLNNRTPFLDIKFIKNILRTELSGVYSGFFEHNPLKRFKGQVLYSHIIKKTYPAFVKVITDKNYKPNDLLNSLGKIKISRGYINKKIRKKYKTIDPYAVHAAFHNNASFFQKLPVNKKLFNLQALQQSFYNTENRDAFFVALSQIYWYNYLKKQK